MARNAREFAAVGGRAGSYTLGARLGAGGMGVVYEAVSWVGGDPVAIKFLQPALRHDERARRQFANEAVAAGIVRHPSLVDILDIGETSTGDPFLVMERIRGEALGTLVSRGGPLPVRLAVSIVRDVLGALGRLHDAGIVHGDVKSGNILVDTRGEGRDAPKLIDFGLARVQLSGHDVSRSALDDTEWLSGTPEYMAPEVLRGEPATFTSDLYAIGIVLYELLTGDTPFSGGSSQDISQRHLADEVIPPSHRRVDHEVSRALDGVVLRALAKSQAGRYTSAADLARALDLSLERGALHGRGSWTGGTPRTRDEVPTAVYGRRPRHQPRGRTNAPR